MSVEAYEVGQRNDKHGVDLISDTLPFGRLCYGNPNAVSNAIEIRKTLAMMGTSVRRYRRTRWEAKAPCYNEGRKPCHRRYPRLVAFLIS
jgi:hypothetical protein